MRGSSGPRVSEPLDTGKQEHFGRRLAAVEKKLADDIERRLVNLEVDKAIDAFVWTGDRGEVLGHVDSARAIHTSQKRQPLENSEALTYGKPGTGMPPSHQGSSAAAAETGKIKFHLDVAKLKNELRTELLSDLALLVNRQFANDHESGEAFLRKDITASVASNVDRTADREREVSTFNGTDQAARMPTSFAKGTGPKVFGRTPSQDEDADIPHEESVASTAVAQLRKHADLCAIVSPRDIEDLAKSDVDREKDKEVVSGRMRRMEDLANVQDTLCTDISSLRDADAIDKDKLCQVFFEISRRILSTERLVELKAGELEETTVLVRQFSHNTPTRPLLVADEDSKDLAPGDALGKSSQMVSMSGRERRKEAAEMFNKMRYSASKRTSQQMLKAKIEEKLSSRLESSVWELVIVAASPEIPVTDSIIAIFLLILNVFLQALVCAILMVAFTDDHEEKAQTWRFESGHFEKFATNSGKPMVDRLCQSDSSLELSGLQQTAYKDVAGWLAPFFGMHDGMALVLWCLLVWFLFIWKEIQTTWDRMSCIFDVPRDRITRIYPSDDVFIIGTISTSRKVTSLLAGILRMGVAGVIAYSGSIWLAQTKAIQDLLLNAVALVFVLDIDEVLFETACPTALRGLIENLERLPPHRFVQSIRLPLRSIATFGACITFLISFHQLRLTDHSGTMEKLSDSFCGGNTKFVVGFNAWTNIVFSFEGVVNKASNSLLRNVAEDLANSNPKNEHFKTSSWSQFQTYLKMDLSSNVATFGKCADLVPAEGFMLAPLRHAINMSLSSCQGVTAVQCAEPPSIIRLACPVTCFCNRPRAGSFLIAGCPMDLCGATTDYQDLLKRARTADIDIDILNILSEWHLYWDGYVQYIDSNPSQNVLLLSPNFVASKFLAMGCDGIKFFQNYANVSAHRILDHFCSERSDRRPLRPFCPESCNCQGLSVSWHLFCPKPPTHSVRGCASVLVDMMYPGPHPAQLQPTIAASKCNQSIQSNLTQPLGQYVCTPFGYNGKHVYTFQDVTGWTWSIRWESTNNLDWGAMYLGMGIGLSGASKWTLSSIKTGPLSVGERHVAGRWFVPSGATFPPESGWLPRNASNSDADCAWHEIRVLDA